MIIGNDIVLNVEDFLGAMINSYFCLLYTSPSPRDS